MVLSPRVVSGRFQAVQTNWFHFTATKRMRLFGESSPSCAEMVSPGTISYTAGGRIDERCASTMPC